MTSGTAGGGSGLAFVDCGMSADVGSLPEGRRRGVAVNGRRIKTIDIHAHCAVPEALALMGTSSRVRRTGRTLTWQPPCRCA